MKKRVKDKTVQGGYKWIDVPYDGPRLAVPAYYDGDPPIYVAQRIVTGLHKKAEIISMQAAPDLPRRVIIEYRPKRGKGQGKAELLDLGPNG
jgi:hypothetical protein